MSRCLRRCSWSCGGTFFPVSRPPPPNFWPAALCCGSKCQLQAWVRAAGFPACAGLGVSEAVSKHALGWCRLQRQTWPILAWQERWLGPPAAECSSRMQLGMLVGLPVCPQPHCHSLVADNSQPAQAGCVAHARVPVSRRSAADRHPATAGKKDSLACEHTAPISR